MFSNRTAQSYSRKREPLEVRTGQPLKLAGMSSDKCAINVVARGILNPFFPNSIAFICFPHQYNNTSTGGAFKADEADEFINSEWLIMHSQSHLAPLLCKFPYLSDMGLIVN